MTSRLNWDNTMLLNSISVRSIVTSKTLTVLNAKSMTGVAKEDKTDLQKFILTLLSKLSKLQPFQFNSSLPILPPKLLEISVLNHKAKDKDTMLRTSTSMETSSEPSMRLNNLASKIDQLSMVQARKFLTTKNTKEITTLIVKLLIVLVLKIFLDLTKIAAVQKISKTQRRIFQEKSTKKSTRQLPTF